MASPSSGNYDNTGYWRELHDRLGSQLRAVGHPTLSEQANRLKYESETESVLAAMDVLRAALASRAAVEVLDLGAGTGYWTAVLREWLARQRLPSRFTALDISRAALAALHAGDPDLAVVEADLKTAAPGNLRGRFDVVTAMYCLHHLVRYDEFANGLRFAAACVREGGSLILMDPMLRLPYSPFHTVDFATWKGNGLPRTLTLIDDLLDRDGLVRAAVLPAVSFVLNGPIESRGALRFSLLARTWRALGRLYGSERATVAASPVLRGVDRWLKRFGATFSSSVAVYLRRGR